MLFVSPIRRVVRRVPKKGDDTVIFDQPCFYNPCLDDLYIAFIVQYPLAQSTILYLLDLMSPLRSSISMSSRMLSSPLLLLSPGFN